MKVQLYEPKEEECAECGTVLNLWEIRCKDFPGYEDLPGTVTLCETCLEHEEAPEYLFPED
jgi:hypothetical protein